MQRRLDLLSLLLVSAVMLAFEIFLTKLAALTVDMLLVYAVIGIAMLGGGAAGSWLSVASQRTAPEQAPRTIARGCLAFAASLLITSLVFVRLSPLLAWFGLLGTVMLAGLLAAPFFAAGVCITTALASSASAVGLRYAANLVGSAAGCFLPLWLLAPLGGERLVALLATVTLALALFEFRRWRLRLRGADVAVAVMTGALALALWVAPRRVMPVVPEPTGQAAVAKGMATQRGTITEERFWHWDPTGHIAVYGYRGVPGHADPYPYLFYAQDGSNGSLLIQWAGETRRDVQEGKVPPTPVSRLCDETLYALGWAEPRRRVLVIGLGGAPDVQCALHHEAESVDVVEINRTTVRAVTGVFDELLGRLGRDPRVRWHVQDGRSFVRTAQGSDYDLIQLSGVDTKAALSAGSLLLSENHLYTVEAFEDYLGALAPGGALVLLRFTEAELFRLMSTASVALARRGARPELHLAAVRNDVIVGLLVSREPLTAASAAAIQERFDFDRRPFLGGVDPFFYEMVASDLKKPPRVEYLPGDARSESTARFMAALTGGTLKSFEASYPYKIFPTRDARPFFFDLFPPGNPTAELAYGFLHGLLLAITLLAAVGILLPVVFQRAHRRALSLHPAIYFGSVGLAYLFVEIWLLHRFGLLLGHQTYALVVVLSSVLVGTGAGALLGERWVPASRPRALLGVAGIALLVGALHALAPELLAAAWSLAPFPRGALLVVVALALGFFMGLPFPAGLRWLALTRPAAVPWCIGINGFSSVLATVLVTPVALAFSYREVLLLGVACYGLAALAAGGFREPSLGGSGPPHPGT